MSFFASLPTGQYIGLFGAFVIIAFAWMVSKHRDHVQPLMVVKVFGLQLLLAYFILCTQIGRSIFSALATGFQQVYEFANEGASFVFGALCNPAGPWGFIFGVKVVSIIIFFGALMSVLFHLGIVQRVVGAIAFVVQPLFGTSGAETLCAAANSMLGQTEAPLLIKHYLKSMTESEMLVVMVSGFATLSGAILAVYGGLGVPIQHLLAASVMAVPSSILMAKILLPETEKSKTTEADPEPVVETKNILDAISVGTSDGMFLAVNVAAMLISFISLIAMVNFILASVSGWFGLHITLTVIFGKLFSGVAYLIGINGYELETAGSLLGTKLVINEFVAYSDMVKAGLSARSEAILTYALCGFANFSCIGIQIGGIGALVPSKRAMLTRLGMRALLGGTLANLLNAAIASLFI
jgi:CNT family concentrative nucleoside transporter